MRDADFRQPSVCSHRQTDDRQTDDGTEDCKKGVVTTWLSARRTRTSYVAALARPAENALRTGIYEPAAQPIVTHITPLAYMWQDPGTGTQIVCGYKAVDRRTHTQQTIVCVIEGAPCLAHTYELCVNHFLMLALACGVLIVLLSHASAFCICVRVCDVCVCVRVRNACGRGRDDLMPCMRSTDVRNFIRTPFAHTISHVWILFLHCARTTI